MAGPVETGGKFLPEVCSRADLSVMLDISVRGITDLAATGVLVRAEQKGFYQTVPSIHAYIGKLRAQAAGRGGALNLNDERAKLAQVERQAAEIRLASTRGEVLTLKEVSEAWTGLVRKVKATVLAFPSRARSTIPHLTAHDQETLRQIAVDGLNELAEEVEMGLVGAEPVELMVDEDAE